MNLMKFMVKCKVLCMAWSNHQYQYRWGYKWTESSPVKKVLRVLVENLDMKWQHALSAQKTNHMLDCTKRSVVTPSAEVILTLYSTLMRHHLHTALGLLGQETH